MSNSFVLITRGEGEGEFGAVVAGAIFEILVSILGRRELCLQDLQTFDLH